MVVWVAQVVVVVAVVAAAAAETDYTIWTPTNDKKKVPTRLGFKHRNLCTSPTCYSWSHTAMSLSDYKFY